MQSHQDVEQSISGAMADCSALCNDTQMPGEQYDAGEPATDTMKPNYPETDAADGL